MLATNDVVKLAAESPGDNLCRPGYTDRVETIGDRISQILSRRGISARELGRRAGLAEQHISLLIGRYRKNPQTHTEVSTLQAVARGAGVSFNWLATGNGSPDDHDESAPSPTYTDDSTPVMENVEGYLAVEQEDRKAHPEVEEEYWLRGRKAGPLMIIGPARPGDAYRLAKLAKEMGSPERLAWLLEERDRRIKALQGELEAERAKQHAALAKKLAKQQQGK